MEIGTFIDSVELIYRPVEVEQFAPHLTEVFRDLIPHSLLTVSVVNHATNRWNGWQSRPMCADWLQRAAEILPDNPCMEYLKKGGLATTVSFTDFLTERQLRDAPLYADLLRPVDVENHVSAVLRVPRHSAYCSFYRDIPFSDEERTILELFHPHLSRAFLLTQLYDKLRFAGQLSRTPQPELDLLTSREREVIHWIAQGKRDSEIGAILKISPRTVHKHVSNSLGKLCVETRAAAAALWREVHGNERYTSRSILDQLAPRLNRRARLVHGACAVPAVRAGHLYEHR